MSDKQTTIIKLDNIIKDYTTSETTFRALKGVSLDIKKGSFISVVGKSGSGKSTLMNMITGIDRPTDGLVYVNNILISGLKESSLAKWRGTNIGIVFQFFQLLPTLTILENILMAMDFAGTIQRAERKSRAIELLDMVGIADQANKFPSTLSGGQQQRAAIARALANDPPILIADEPTGNLDTHTADEIIDIFKTLKSQGKTVIIVSHDKDIAKHCDSTIYLRDGEITYEGSEDNVQFEMV